MNQPRQLPGTPIGGQFAPINRPEASGELVDETGELVDTAPKHLSDLEREDRIAVLRSEIDNAMNALSSREGWEAFLESRAKFHSYSLNNASLIFWQRPDATQVAGFNDWKNKHGRTVRRGERAIWILAPLTRKVEVEKDGKTETTNRVFGFRAVPVFDISSTDGPPLPERPTIDAGELGDTVPEKMVEELSGFITSRGFSISRADTGDTGGWTQFTQRQVVISDKATAAEAARTLAHEAAHIALGHGERIKEYHMRPGGERPDMEVEAESVAYVIGRSYGMDSIGAKSFEYIDSWAQGNAEKVKATANAVVAGTRAILDEIKAAAPRATAA